MDAIEVVAQLEIFLKLLVASLDAQVVTITILGQHKFRDNLIFHVKKLLSTLSATLERFESDLVAGIEEKAERILETSASLIHSLDAARAAHILASPDAPTKARKNHKNLTSKLALSEEKKIAEVVARLAPLRQKVSALLAQVERL